MDFNINEMPEVPSDMESSSGFLPSIDMSDLPSEIMEEIEEMKAKLAADFHAKMHAAKEKFNAAKAQIEELNRLKDNVGPMIAKAVSDGVAAVDTFMQENINAVVTKMMKLIRLLISAPLKENLPDSAVNIFMNKQWPGIAKSVTKTTQSAFKIHVEADGTQAAPVEEEKKGFFSCCGNDNDDGDEATDNAKSAVTETIVQLKKGIVETITGIPGQVPVLKDLINLGEKVDGGTATKKSKKETEEEEATEEELQETSVSDWMQTSSACLEARASPAPRGVATTSAPRYSSPAPSRPRPTSARGPSSSAASPPDTFVRQRAVPPGRIVRTRPQGGGQAVPAGGRGDDLSASSAHNERGKVQGGSTPFE